WIRGRTTPRRRQAASPSPDQCSARSRSSKDAPRRRKPMDNCELARTPGRDEFYGEAVESQRRAAAYAKLLADRTTAVERPSRDRRERQPDSVCGADYSCRAL